MRNLIYNSLNTCMLIMLSALLFSCEKDAKYKEYVYPQPSVDGIYPTSGYIASQVCISGIDFGNRLEPVKVFFGGVEATKIISCKNNRIIVEVPAEAQSGDISLKVWQYTLESIGKFTVIPTPAITSITSDNNENGFATGGDVITIHGSAFGSSIEDVKVTINKKPAVVNSVMDNAIKAVVPDDYGSGLVVVSIKGYELTGSALVDPNKKGDVTDLFLKNCKQSFQRGDSGDGEWGTALYWQTNSSFNGSSLQFPDDQPGGLLTMVGKSNMWDGALYQITLLPKGTYEFKVLVADTKTVGGRYGAQFAVMKGEGDFPKLTDVGAPWHFADLTNILGTILVTSGAGEYSYSVELTETTTVKIGFATMLANNNYVKVSEIQIIRK